MFYSSYLLYYCFNINLFILPMAKMELTSSPASSRALNARLHKNTNPYIIGLMSEQI